jgi:drug/metabolite transporter (DMT)-like permease
MAFYDPRMVEPRVGALGAAVALAALAIAQGAIPVLVRGDAPATHLVAGRVTVAAFFLLLFGLVTRNLRVPRVRRGRVVILGLALAGHWLAFFLAIKLTTVAVALAVVYLGPVTSAMLAAPVLGERVKRGTRIGLGFALIGTLLVVRPGAGATVAGVVAALISAALLVVLMVFGKPAARDLGGLGLATWQLPVAAIALLPFSVQAVRQSAEFWPQFLVLGAVFTGLAGVIYWGALSRLPVAVVSVIMYLEPASAAIWATAMLGETPALATWVGVGMVVAGGTIAAVEATDEEAIGVPATL